MHPFALYLVAMDHQRNQRAAATRDRRRKVAPVQAMGVSEPTRVSRLGRLVAIVRRRSSLPAAAPARPR